MITLDFETQAIVGNPTVKAPAPVGLAYKRNGTKGKYLSWGHPGKNNCDGPGEAIAVIQEAKDRKEPMLFHNGKFDLSVMEQHLGIKPPSDPLLVHDTQYSLFLQDPYAKSLSLKPSAQRVLGLPPEEQDVLKEWILRHVPEATPKTFGAYIAQAPAEIVGPYAIGDVDRTYALHQHLKDYVQTEAYRREQRLLPILVRGERRGIRCDLEKLGSDLEFYEQVLGWCNGEIHRMLRNRNVNIDSGEELADALEVAGMVGQWQLTPTGRRSTARDALEASITHGKMLAMLRYRGALSHCLSNFARPWMAMAQSAGGILHPEWNQVRQTRTETDLKGTRTGRLSSNNPNFQNPPNEYNIAKPQDDLPDLPLMRKYLLPHKGRVWLKRDYSQQELRILAHYSEGRLYRRYQEDPTIDAHAETEQLIRETTGLTLERKYVKITGFSVIYGAGTTGLGRQLKVPTSEAVRMRTAYFTALPEVPKLMRDCQTRGKMGQSIKTWGGREYFTEPPTFKNGRSYSFEYKLLNYLIQGSAADCTKEAAIRWDEIRGDGEFLATVHDEMDIDAPAGAWQKPMAALKEAMESIEFEVKMLSDGFKGPNWATLEACK